MRTTLRNHLWFAAAVAGACLALTGCGPLTHRQCGLPPGATVVITEGGTLTLGEVDQQGCIIVSDGAEIVVSQS